MRLLSVLALTLCSFCMPAAEFGIRDGDRVVFLGDSITAAGHYTVYIEAYLRTRFPEQKFTIINSGKGSETVSNLSEVDHPGRRPWLFARWEKDAVAYDPTLIVSCYGMNDGIYHPPSTERLKAYQDGIHLLLERTAKETKARNVLVTPAMYDGKNVGKPDVRPEETYGYKQPFADYDKVLAQYAEWLKTLNSPKLPVADVHGAFVNHITAKRATDPAYRLSGDGIHPNETGHLIMAMTILKALGAPALVDSVEIDAKAGKVLAGNAQHLVVKGEHVEFTWTTKLPMPCAEKWDPAAVKDLKFAAELNQHVLRVKGLTHPGCWLVVDGVQVEMLGNSDLEAGVNLSSIESPISAAAAEVLALIYERRKLGNDPYRSGFDAAQKDGKWNESWKSVNERLAKATAPRTFKIQIGPAW